jgi:hypothetical protein
VAAVPSAVSYALLGAAVAGSRGLSPLSMVPLGIGLLFSVAVVVRARRVGGRPGYDAGESS